MESLKRVEYFDIEFDEAPGHPSRRSLKPSRPPVLLILHTEHASPGYVGLALKSLGFPLDIRRPCMGESLPSSLENHSGAMIFGGPMSVNDNENFVRRELEWISVPLKEKKPFLGICLGAQMLAKHLGSEVGPDPDGYVEVGYYPVRPVAEGAGRIDVPDQVFQWHLEGFSLPRGAKLICQGEGPFANQGFSYDGSAYGFQFHPEITFGMLKQWISRTPENLTLKGAQAEVDLLEAHVAQAVAVRYWLQEFMKS